MKLRNRLTGMLMLLSLGLFAKEIDPSNQMDSMIYFAFITIIIIIVLVIFGNYRYQKNSKKTNNLHHSITIALLESIVLLLLILYLIIDMGWGVISIWAVFSFLLLQTLYSGWSSTRGVIKHEKPTITADINQKNIQDIESEDVLLDHDYDGIKELDNDLPLWWLYGFYCCIAFALFYLFDYHIINNSPLQAQEYVIEIQQTNDEIKLNVKQVEIVQLVDEQSISNGAQIYANNCIACHLVDGGGSVGPNLTDDYWIHGGDFDAVVKVINDGVLDKGMVAWKTVLNPTQVNEVASYLFTLPRVDGKDPQGEPYIE